MDIQEKLMHNEALMEDLAQVQTADELTALLAAHDVILDADTNIDQLFAQIKAASADELDENALDDVSGGITVPALAAGVGIAIAIAYKLYKRGKGRSHGGGGRGSFGGGRGGGGVR